jgi:hypothetical protein
VRALLRVLAAPGADARVTYFRSLVETSFPAPADREAGLLREYLRVMRFVFEKEFVAQGSASPAGSIAQLYRTRGLSTDSAVEAGFVVHLGLGIVKGLRPAERIRRVLIVGPGLDLAPRTGLNDASPPASYQPWAVIDALVGLGLARMDDLEVVAADINPRVVAHLEQARGNPPVLTLASDVREDERVKFTPDFAEYLTALGGAVSGRGAVRPDRDGAGRLRKVVPVGAAAAKTLRAARLDVVTERLTGPPFDLVIATNILPYFDDRQLALAICNIAAMTRSGGVFLHNEPRSVLGDIAAAAGLPFEQSRHAVVAEVTGARAPLFDSVFLHARSPNP